MTYNVFAGTLSLTQSINQSIVFCSACMMSSLRKFTFAISSSGEFLVMILVMLSILK